MITLKKFLAGEPSLAMLNNLNGPLSQALRTATISSDDYDVEIKDGSTVYRMVVPGRSEEEITIETVGNNLIVKSDPTDWLPAQQFTFGLPPNRDKIEAELVDGVLTVTVSAKEPTQGGKIKISKRK